MIPQRRASRGVGRETGMITPVFCRGCGKRILQTKGPVNNTFERCGRCRNKGKGK